MEINRTVRIELSVEDINNILEGYSVEKEGIRITKDFYHEEYHLMEGSKNPIIEEIKADWLAKITVDRVYRLADLDWLDHTVSTDEIHLDGKYTADQLEALVIAMREERKDV